MPNIKPRLVRIDSDIYTEIKKIAKEENRSVPKQINRFLRKVIEYYNASAQYTEVISNEEETYE